MYCESDNQELSFSDQFFGNPDPVPDDHRYLRIVAAIDWDRLLDQLADLYDRERGRRSKPVKAMVILLIIKHLAGLADEEVVECLKMNLALQKACNLTFLRAQRFVSPSSLSRFRKRLGQQGAAQIAQATEAFIGKRQKSRTAVVDSTVVPSDIAYPTDLNLLEKARQVLVRFIKQWQSKPVRTQNRKARRTFLRYVKLGQIFKRRAKGNAGAQGESTGKPSKTGDSEQAEDANQGKLFVQTHEKMLGIVTRNFRQASKVIAAVGDSEIPEGVRRRALDMLATIERLLAQQQEVLSHLRRNGSKQGLHILDRIVSISRPYVRPIVRGKIPVSTEFGSKLLLEMRDGFVTVLKITFNAMPDVEMIHEFFSRWQGMTLGADRGFHSAENAVLAQQAGVVQYLVEKKGSISLPKTKAVRRARGLRAALEGHIGVAKRKYGLGRNRYKRGPDGECQWIYLGITAMNLRKAAA